MWLFEVPLRTYLKGLYPVFTVVGTEVLEGLVSTSKWPRNEAKFLASSRPRPRKTRIKSLVLKMAEKKAEIPRNSSSRPRKGRGKGKNSLPRLVHRNKGLERLSCSAYPIRKVPKIASFWKIFSKPRDLKAGSFLINEVGRPKLPTLEVNSEPYS